MQKQIPSPREKCPLRGEIQYEMVGIVLTTDKEKDSPVVGVLFDKGLRCSRAFTLHPQLVDLHEDNPSLEREQLDLIYHQIENCRGPWVQDESKKVCLAIGEILAEPEVEVTLREALIEEFRKYTFKLLTEYSNN